jgi:uncharacterized repeat protein (TIGR01451 family)
MKKNIYALAFLFNTFFFSANAQVFTWNKTVDTITSFSENIYGIFTKVKETADKHIIYVQNKHQISNQFGNLKYDSVIISKYTFDGNIVWEKKYPLTSGGSINDFIETPDKGFLLIGEIGLNNSVVKLDSNGNVVFIRNYLNTDSLMKLNQIVATNDGNYIVTSSKEILEDVCLWPTVYSVKHSTFITKINSFGNIVWQKFINESKFRIGSINYPFTSSSNNLGLKFDFYDTVNNDFNVLFYSKQNYTLPPMYLNLMHLDKDGNKLDSTIIEELPVTSNGWYCETDGPNLIIKPTANGYTYFKKQIDTSLLTEYHYNKQGQLTDSINRIWSNQYPYALYSIESDYFSISREFNDNVHFITRFINTFPDNGFRILISDTDFINFKVNVLFPDSIANGTHRILTKINDSTLLFVSEVSYNIPSDSGIYLKFFRISLNTNQINYAIYIDRNNNGSIDATDTAFSDCFIELNDGNSTSVYKPYNNAFLQKDGTYIKYLLAGNYTSKLISYNQTLKYYDVEPISKNTIFTTDTRGIDSITFRLTPKPNIEDLQVSIIPTIGARPGFTTSYKIIAKNVGTKMMYLTTVKFVKDSLQTFTDSTTYTLDGDTLFWQIDSLSLLEQREISVSVLNAIPPTLNANDTLHLAAVIYPMENDSFVQDNYASLNQVVRNSVDPNDKIETHGGTIPFSAVQNRDYLYYTIRFQNTGNSYATRIVITDTLTENADTSTLEFLSSSVPFVMNVVNRKYITWTAASTYLPDSTSDESNSHGYISFRIKPKAGLLPNDEMTNRASIVFDYNAAISTNTCTTKIIEQRILSVKNNEIKSISLFPNPTNGNVQLNMNLIQNKNYTLRIININGNILSSQNIKGNSGENNISIDLSNYANGLYFIQVSDETGNLFYGKVVKQ